MKQWKGVVKFSILAILILIGLGASTVVSVTSQAHAGTFFHQIPQVRTLILLEEGMIWGESQMTFPEGLKIEEGSSGIVTILFPSGVEITDVEGLNAESPWRQEVTARGTMVTVHLKKGRVISSLSITYQKEDPAWRQDGNKFSVMKLPVPEIQGFSRVNGEIGVAAKGSLRVEPVKVQGGRTIDVQELSSAFQNLEEPILFAYGYHKSVALAMKMEKGSEIPVLQGTIDAANALTVISLHGKMITRVLYQVKANRLQFLSLSLPDDVTLFGAFVNNAPVKPIKGEGKEILIPLGGIDRSAFTGNTPVAVEVTYFATKNHFWAGGSIQGILPKSELPTTELLWSLYIPVKDRPLWISGNLEQIGGGNYVAGGAVPALTPPEQPASGFWPFRKDKAAGSAQLRRETELRQMEMEGKMGKMADEIQHGNFSHSTGTGILPVRFNIPERGRLIRFSGLLLVNEFPTARAIYMASSIYPLARLALLAGLMMLSWQLIRGHLPSIRKKFFGTNAIPHDEAAH